MSPSAEYVGHHRWWREITALARGRRVVDGGGPHGARLASAGNFCSMNLFVRYTVGTFSKLERDLISKLQKIDGDNYLEDAHH
ncbi:hypothetical protein GUJ93_ZPchr0002g26673 [Zizania palustris]|uniref:Uncharacterized protein n=1 Tax=Zizania palustris TaxID=103762 RepID=A0A8J5S155_ZIZPA|nr:hypothetical protein GUJ93_ZPchr0002g26673 [Zizania palustris]